MTSFVKSFFNFQIQFPHLTRIRAVATKGLSASSGYVELYEVHLDYNNDNIFFPYREGFVVKVSLC